MKQLILLVGIPGSGKTTLAQSLVKQGFARLCADDIRLELYADAAEQGNAKDVFAIFFERLKVLLQAEQDIVIDNTNIKFDHRQQIINRAREFQYTNIQIWVLDVSLAVCLERNKKRPRQVPEGVITNLFNTLSKYGKPTSSEGKIVIVKTDQLGKWQFSFPQ